LVTYSDLGSASNLYYPLSEGAIVAELCNLIHANLEEKFKLRCEIQDSKIIEQWPKKLGPKARADLVVSIGKVPKVIIEVKRATASNADIDADLLRLAVARSKLRNVRAYLMLVSEAHRPTRFLIQKSRSMIGEWKVSKFKNYFYRVRRTWKAAHAFDVREKAQYACLIEVYPKNR
jgi:hypothetical protein